MAKKIYVAIGDTCMLSNLRYPFDIQTSGSWLIHEVTKTKDTLEVRIVINKKHIVIAEGIRFKRRKR